MDYIVTTYVKARPLGSPVLQPNVRRVRYWRKADIRPFARTATYGARLRNPGRQNVGAFVGLLEQATWYLADSCEGPEVAD